MAQRPAELTPLASTRHFFGAELRYWRIRRGLSLAQLGQRVFASADLIAKVEKARRWPGAELVERCEAVLDSGGLLQRLYAFAQAERVAPTIEDDLPGNGIGLIPILVVAASGVVDPANVLAVLRLLNTAPMAFELARPDSQTGAVIDIDEARARRSVGGATTGTRRS